MTDKAHFRNIIGGLQIAPDEVIVVWDGVSEIDNRIYIPRAYGWYRSVLEALDKIQDDIWEGIMIEVERVRNLGFTCWEFEKTIY
jgi:hypothetical protein